MANAALTNNDFFNGKTSQRTESGIPVPPQGYQQQFGQEGQQQFGRNQFGQYAAQGQPQQQPGVPFPQASQQAPQWGGPQAPSPEQLNNQFNAPAATRDQMDRMSYEDVIAKTAGLFAVVLLAAAIAWIFPLLTFVGAIGGLVLGIILAFKRTPAPGLSFAFAVMEGFLAGGMSSILEAQYGGIVFQALLATACVIGVTLLLFMNGKVRTSPKMTQFFAIAGLGYLAFSLVNFGLMLFGAGQEFGTWGLRSIEVFGIPVGILIGIFAVVMGAYMLISDFEFIKNGVEGGAPRAFGWIAAYSLVSTVVYIYIEILRIIAIFREN